MALNDYMHQRNSYKKHKPSFRELAAKYDFFKEVAHCDESGKVTIDFKQPKQLAALARALLLNDFALDVKIPTDRLIPTIPLRLNYILWLEDVLAGNYFIYETKQYALLGIPEAQTPPTILDIGTGSCCIYPIIGARKNGWNFIGAEFDQSNFSHSVDTVNANNLQDKICRKHFHFN